LPPITAATAAFKHVVMAELSLEHFAALYPLGGRRVPPVLRAVQQATGPLTVPASVCPANQSSRVFFSWGWGGEHKETYIEQQRRYNMNGKFQMQGGKNWILPK
jgi:hypothetical protein